MVARDPDESVGVGGVIVDGLCPGGGPGVVDGWASAEVCRLDAESFDLGVVEDREAKRPGGVQRGVVVGGEAVGQDVALVAVWWDVPEDRLGEGALEGV